MFLQPFLWSYDLSQMDITRDKQIIIKNILDYGTSDATTWLKDTYDERDIRFVIESTPLSDWGKKSISLWSLIYDAVPKNAQRVMA